VQGWALQSPTLKANVVQVRRDLYQHVGELDVHVWSFAYREIRQMRMHDGPAAARQFSGVNLSYILDLGPKIPEPQAIASPQPSDRSGWTMHP
jgi:hypothetical protein